jgi:flagellar basal-body rod modification protein FlgD
VTVDSSTPVTIPSPTTTSPTATAGGTNLDSTTGKLGEADFLSLLTTELEHQDPTQPMDDTQFIAQLAQFTSLQKLTSMDTTLTSIAQLLAAQAAANTPPSGATTSTTGVPSTSATGVPSASAMGLPSATQPTTVPTSTPVQTPGTSQTTS